MCVCGGSSESLLWRMIGRLERLAWNDEPFDRRQVTPGGLRTSLFDSRGEALGWEECCGGELRGVGLSAFGVSW